MIVLPAVLVAIALVAGYAWLAVLARRQRALATRLAVHVCRDVDEVTAGTGATTSQAVTVAELLARHRNEP